MVSNHVVTEHPFICYFSLDNILYVFTLHSNTVFQSITSQPVIFLKDFRIQGPPCRCYLKPEHARSTSRTQANEMIFIIILGVHRTNTARVQRQCM